MCHSIIYDDDQRYARRALQPEGQSKPVSFRLSFEDFELLVVESRRRGVTPSNFIRSAVMTELAKGA